MEVKKHQVILFLDNNARIITTDNPAPYSKMLNVLVDPDRSAVWGHPPHYWKIEGDKVVPIDNETKVIRDHLHQSMKWDEQELGKFVLKAHQHWERKMRLRNTIMVALAFLIPTLIALWLR